MASPTRPERLRADARGSLGRRDLPAPAVWALVLVLLAPARAAATFFVTEGGYSFDVHDSSSVWSGGGGELSVGGNIDLALFGTYAGCYYLAVDGVRYSVGEGGGALADRTVSMPPMAVGELEVRRSAFVPETGGDYVRYYDTVENLGDAAVEVDVEYSCYQWLEEGAFAVWGTESGDILVDVSDHWLGTGPSGIPWRSSVSTAHAYFGRDAAVEPSAQWAFNDPYEFWLGESHALFVVSIPPGGTAAFLAFGFQGIDEDLLEEDAAAVVADVDVGTAGLSAEELALVVTWATDVDLDGFRSSEGDCDDHDAAVHPGAEELCDGLDNDCDGERDEGHPRSELYPDADADGYGQSGGTPELACAVPPGLAASDDDCDDSCASCHPGGIEVCDGRDNDCDDGIDEGFVFETYYRDVDGDGYGPDGTATSSCEALPGWSLAGGDCDDRCALCRPGLDEVCDGLDNDCDGEVDEELTLPVWVDADGDGYGNPPSRREACSLDEGFVANGDDCDDLSAEALPGGTEVCDGLDNDCDGQVDEELTSRYYLDLDGDGYGDPAAPVDACELPADAATNGDDCDDDAPTAHPGGEEVYDGLDNDCDGEVDDVPAADGDADGDADAGVDADAPLDADRPVDAEAAVDADAPGDDPPGCSCSAPGAARPASSALGLLALVPATLSLLRRGRRGLVPGPFAGSTRQSRRSARSAKADEPRTSTTAPR